MLVKGQGRVLLHVSSPTSDEFWVYLNTLNLTWGIGPGFRGKINLTLEPKILSWITSFFKLVTQHIAIQPTAPWRKARWRLKHKNIAHWTTTTYLLNWWLMSTQLFRALWPRRVLRGAGGFHTYYDRNGYTWKVPLVKRRAPFLDLK